MKIAVWHNLPSGGGKRQLYDHIRELVRRGHHVEAWCPEFAARTDFLPLSDLIPEHIVPLDMTGEFHTTLRPARLVKRMISALDEHCRKCAEQIESGDFNLLYANSCTFIRVPSIARYCSLPSIVYLGEPYRWFYEALPELPWIAPQASSLLEANDDLDTPEGKELLQGIRLQAREEVENAREFELILVNSLFTRESLLRSFNLESKVCYLGIDSDFYKPVRASKESFVVGLGTLYHAKGIDRAIRAIGTISESSRPSLIWIGNGAWQRDLHSYQSLAARLNVNFVPKMNIPHEEVLDYLSAAAVMVYTSRLEPFGYAPLEANACGTAVVGIAEGGIRESIVDGCNGLLTKSDDPKELGSLISSFTDHLSYAVEFGKKARDHVLARWSSKAGGDRIEAYLTDLAEKRTTYPPKSFRLARSVAGESASKFQIRFGIDRFAFHQSALQLSGWAYIDDGIDSRGTEHFLFIKHANKSAVLSMQKVIRRDVTESTGGKGDYDESGFSIGTVCAQEQIEEMGIIVVRSSKAVYHKLPLSVSN
ncbi:MAG: glycosyltransferase family 4 protein [Acidobacteria bacterium]|nr:glycosyltransferase family 4 protein [Acidobacteriota bacterium]